MYAAQKNASKKNLIKLLKGLLLYLLIRISYTSLHQNKQIARPFSYLERGTKLPHFTVDVLKSRKIVKERETVFLCLYLYLKATSPVLLKTLQRVSVLAFLSVNKRTALAFLLFQI